MDAADTRDRFLLLEDVEGPQAALAAPMDRWLAFLHPDQRDVVSVTFSGPAKVSGSAGTGKTVAAMHRAKHLVKQGEKVLFTTYVTTLCENIESNVRRLCNPSLRSQITIKTVRKTAMDLVEMVEPQARSADDKMVRSLLDSKRLRYGDQYPARFVRAEWEQVVRQQGIFVCWRPAINPLLPPPGDGRVNRRVEGHVGTPTPRFELVDVPIPILARAHQVGRDL